MRHYIENGLSEDEAAVSLLAALDETLRKDYGFTAAADQETKKETASDSRNDRFFPTADITRIEIEDTAHDVLLLPGRGDCLELQYDEEDAQNYVVEQKGSVLHIYFQPKKEEKRNFSFLFFHMSLSSDEPLRLFFPSNGFRPEINIKTLSGDIQTSVPLGAANLFTMSGDILFRGEAESLRVSSTSGDVRFEGQAQSLEFKTTSGDIRLIGSAAIPTCFIRSTSGDLHLQHMQSEELDISTGQRQYLLHAVRCSGLQHQIRQRRYSGFLPSAAYVLGHFDQRRCQCSALGSFRYAGHAVHRQR